MNNVRVLIAEDDESSRVYLQRMLTARGYHVDAAENGKKAWELAGQVRPDIVISDIMMPEMDGFELCRRIKLDPGLREIPFVFYTATYTDSRDEALAMSLGASGFVLKPAQPDALLQHVEHALQSYQAGALPRGTQEVVAATEIDQLYESTLARKLEKKVQELNAGRERLEVAALAFRISSEAMMVTDEEHRIVECNAALENITGYSRAEVLGHPPVFFPTSGLAGAAALWDASDRREQWRGEVQCQHRSGRRIPVQLKLNSGHQQSTGQWRRVTLFSDISERKQLEDTLRKLSLAVEQSPSSVIITDLQANIIYANAAFLRVTGYALSEVLGQNARILHSGKTPPQTFIELWQHLTRGETWRGEFVNRGKHGQEFIEDALISPVRDDNGLVQNYLAIKDNITAQRQNAERIQYLAQFDQLTGLPNRTTFGEHFQYSLNLAQRSGEHFVVMILDIDHFKTINDSLGQGIGDQLLVHVARALRTSIRDVDTVSRLGADEFIFLFPGMDSKGAMHKASELLKIVAKPVVIEGHEVVTTCSVGIAIYPGDGQDFDTLASKAGIAMSQVKQSSHNDFRFSAQATQVDLQRTLALSNALRHALARGQLHLHFQPQVAMRDGRVTGAEALLRWSHPELGAISPAEFIPVAESSGLIIEIGDWVLRHACHQMKTWIDEGLPIASVAVNLSAIQFHQTDLVQRILDVLAEYALPPSCLELELTEAVAMRDPAVAVKVMDRLHEHGIRLSIDDFGTGYSSLSYLKRFRVSKLKIDQSFIRELGEDPGDKTIVAAVIHMANGLGIRTIAEGVETASQLAFLRLNGCDEVQGYYFCKPLPSDAFGQFLRAANGRAGVTIPEY